MGHNTTHQNLMRILDVIARLEGPSHNNFVDDTLIAQELSISIQEVRDYLDLLEREGKIQSANAAGGHSALLTANGRIALRDPEYKFSNAISPTIIHVIGNQGVILNVNSKLNAVSQSITTSPYIQERDNLGKLVAQLNDALKQIPSEYIDEAEAVVETTKALIDTLNKEKPNKSTLKITASGLKQAAENIAHIAPAVLTVANEIIAGLHLSNP